MNNAQTNIIYDLYSLCKALNINYFSPSSVQNDPIMLFATSVYYYNANPSSSSNICEQLAHPLSLLYSRKNSIISNFLWFKNGDKVDSAKNISAFKTIAFKVFQDLGEREVDMLVFDEVWQKIENNKNSVQIKKECLD